MTRDVAPPPRLIARLDIKGPNVIKGIHLEGLRVVGQPGPMARRYYEQGVDEIIYMDTVASLYGRNNILPVVEEAARDIFVPLTVGGGIRIGRRHHRRAALRAPTRSPSTPRRSPGPTSCVRPSNALGSQCIVLSIEAKLRGEGRWEALTDNGRERTGVDVLEWVCRGRRAGRRRDPGHLGRQGRHPARLRSRAVPGGPRTGVDPGDRLRRRRHRGPRGRGGRARTAWMRSPAPACSTTTMYQCRR